MVHFLNGFACQKQGLLLSPQSDFPFAPFPSKPANSETNQCVFKRSKLNLLYGACFEGVAVDPGRVLYWLLMSFWLLISNCLGLCKW